LRKKDKNKKKDRRRYRFRKLNFCHYSKFPDFSFIQRFHSICISVYIKIGIFVILYKIVFVGFLFQCKTKLFFAFVFSTKQAWQQKFLSQKIQKTLINKGFNHGHEDSRKNFFVFQNSVNNPTFLKTDFKKFKLNWNSMSQLLIRQHNCCFFLRLLFLDTKMYLNLAKKRQN
jgi:hypothetical protein